MTQCNNTTKRNRPYGSSVLLAPIALHTTKGNPRDRTVVYAHAVSFAPMYKSEVEHQYEIRNRQCKGNEDDCDEPPAGTLHIMIMFVECRAPSGCISQLTEQERQKA